MTSQISAQDRKRKGAANQAAAKRARIEKREADKAKAIVLAAAKRRKQTKQRAARAERRSSEESVNSDGSFGDRG